MFTHRELKKLRSELKDITQRLSEIEKLLENPSQNKEKIQKLLRDPFRVWDGESFHNPEEVRDDLLLCAWVLDRISFELSVLYHRTLELWRSKSGTRKVA